MSNYTMGLEPRLSHTCFQTWGAPSPWHVQTEGRSDWRTPRLVQTGGSPSVCSPYIYWQAGGWPSTERLSCYQLKTEVVFVGQIGQNECKKTYLQGGHSAYTPPWQTDRLESVFHVPTMVRLLAPSTQDRHYTWNTLHDRHPLTLVGGKNLPGTWHLAKPTWGENGNSFFKIKESVVNNSNFSKCIATRMALLVFTQIKSCDQCAKSRIYLPKSITCNSYEATWRTYPASLLHCT